MTRLHDTMERHYRRIAEVITQAGQGDPVNWTRLHSLSLLDTAEAGVATTLDALDRQAEQDAKVAEQFDGS